MGNPDVINRLVESGADPNSTTARGDMPIHLAAKAGHTDCLSALIQNGAHVDAKSKARSQDFIILFHCLEFIMLKFFYAIASNLGSLIHFSLQRIERSCFLNKCFQQEI